MNNLRKIVSVLTLTGVVFHEFGHQIFCLLTGVKVHKVCYFRFGNPSGYVVHDWPKFFIQSFLITVGPFLTGTLFAIFFFHISNNVVGDVWQRILFIWLGGSTAIHAFPSDVDAKSLWENTNRQISRSLLALLGYPVVFVIWLVNRLKFVWFDLIYTVLLYVLVLRHR